MKPVTGYWWTQSKEQAGPDAHQSCLGIQARQQDRYAAQLRWGELYSGTTLSSLYTYDEKASAVSAHHDPYGANVAIAINVVQSCVDSGINKITRNRPRTQFLTSNGKWKSRRQAKQLTKFCDGAMASNGGLKKLRKMALDACVFGTGVVKLVPNVARARVDYERILPIEIVIDDDETRNDDPRTAYHTRYIYRPALMAMFDGYKAAQTLIQAAAAGAVDGGFRVTTGDMIRVVEAWHLPDDKETKGRHVIAVADGTLLDESWGHDWFPFVLFCVRERTKGAWGIGWAEDLYGIQIEILKLLRRFSRAGDLVAVPRVFTKPGGLLKKLTNEMGTVYECDDVPTFLTPQGMGPEQFQLLNFYIDKAYEMIGISQLNATGEKPAGLDAAVALREYNDIQSERFATVIQEYENASVEINRRMIGLSADMYANKHDVVVKAPGTRFLESIDWSSIDLEEDEFDMRPFPSSMLPTEPAARFQAIQDYAKDGFIDRDTAMSLFDFPDLDRAMSAQVSAIDDILRMIDLIVDEEKYETPDEFTPPELALKFALGAFRRARADGAPDTVLALLRRFIDDIREIQKQIAAPAAPVAPVQDAAATLAPPVAPLEIQPPIPAPGVPVVPLPGDLGIGVPAGNIQAPV